MDVFEGFLALTRPLGDLAGHRGIQHIAGTVQLILRDKEGDKLEVIEKDGIIQLVPVVVYPKRYVEDLKTEIDDIKAKLLLAKIADELNIPIISAMGAGNKTDPTKFEISDIFKTSVCPLARIMRRELKKLGVKNLKVVYSKEEPKNPPYKIEGEKTVGSLAFVPSVMGLIIAGEVIKDITGLE